jgi:hypothetical protein
LILLSLPEIFLVMASSCVRKTLGAQHPNGGRFKTSGIFERVLDKSIASEVAPGM